MLSSSGSMCLLDRISCHAFHAVVFPILCAFKESSYCSSIGLRLRATIAFIHLPSIAFTSTRLSLHHSISSSSMPHDYYFSDYFRGNAALPLHRLISIVAKNLQLPLGLFISNKLEALLLSRFAPQRPDARHPARLGTANFVAFCLLIRVLFVLLEAPIQILSAALRNSRLLLRALLQRVAPLARLLFLRLHLALRLEVPA